MKSLIWVDMMGRMRLLLSNRQGGFGAFDLYMITEGSEEEIDDEMLANIGKKGCFGINY